MVQSAEAWEGLNPTSNGRGDRDWATCGVSFANPRWVLGRQIFVLQQQFLIHRPSDVRQQASPLHLLLSLPDYRTAEAAL
jgi:hypothetical protein